MKRAAWCLLSAMLFSPSLLPAADLATMIPSDSSLVMIAKDLATLESDVQAFAGKLNLPIPPETIDFDQLLVFTGIAGELGKQAAFVLNKEDIDNNGSGTIVIEFAKIEDVLDSPGIEKGDEEGYYKLEIMGTAAVAYVKDNVAFVQMSAEDTEGLKRFEKIDKSLSSVMTTGQKKAYADHDVYFSFDIVPFREMALAGIDAMAEEMKTGFEQASEMEEESDDEPSEDEEEGDDSDAEEGEEGDDDADEDEEGDDEDNEEDDADEDEEGDDDGNEDDADEEGEEEADPETAQKQMEATYKMMEMYVDGLRALVRDTDSVFGGVEVTADRVGLRVSAGFTPGSEIAKNLPTGAGKTKEYFTGLPDMPFLFAGGMEMKPFAPLMRQFVNLLPQLATDELKGEKIKPEDIESMMAYMDKVDVSKYMMTFGDEENGMSAVGMMTTSNSKELLDSFMTQLKTGNQLMMGLYGANAYGEPKTKKVAGKDVTEITIDLAGMFDSMSALGGAPGGAGPGPEEMQKMMTAIFGTDDGKLKYQLRADKGALAFAMAGTDDPILMVDPSKPLVDSARMKPVLEALPAESLGAFALDITDYFGMFGRMSEAMGGGLPFPKFEKGEPTSPIGIAASTGKDEASIDVVVPVDHVAAIAGYVMQMASMFGPGGITPPPGEAPAEEPAPEF